MKYTAIIWGVLLFLCSACGQKTEVTSPDGRNKLMLMLDESGSLYYQIFFRWDVFRIFLILSDTL